MKADATAPRATDVPSPEDIERVARVVCHTRCVDPDALVWAGPAIQVDGTYYRAGGISRPAWTVFTDVASAALMAARA